ncbi:hypothetical protein [Treponema phagedenis]|uniref:hypothetical protein n=1 Tax=Treponema phagedenis TaxID=162 RepID=UPI002091D9E0|nr:hypothetical protein [Treponema phagedenis]
MDVTKSRYPNSIVLASAKIEISKKDILLDRTTKTWDLQDLEDLGLARGIKISFSSSKMTSRLTTARCQLKDKRMLRARLSLRYLKGIFRF